MPVLTGSAGVETSGRSGRRMVLPPSHLPLTRAGSPGLRAQSGGRYRQIEWAGNHNIWSTAFRCIPGYRACGADDVPGVGVAASAGDDAAATHRYLSPLLR